MSQQYNGMNERTPLLLRMNECTPILLCMSERTLLLLCMNGRTPLLCHKGILFGVAWVLSTQALQGQDTKPTRKYKLSLWEGGKVAGKGLGEFSPPAPHPLPPHHLLPLPPRLPGPAPGQPSGPAPPPPWGRSSP